jgi:hypothetical protein
VSSIPLDDTRHARTAQGAWLPHPVRPLRGCSQESAGTVCARPRDPRSGREPSRKDTPAQSAHLPWRAVPGGTGPGRRGPTHPEGVQATPSGCASRGETAPFQPRGPAGRRAETGPRPREAPRPQRDAPDKSSGPCARGAAEGPSPQSGACPIPNQALFVSSPPPAVPLPIGRRSHAGGSSAPVRSAPRRGASRGWGFEVTACYGPCHCLICF